METHIKYIHSKFNYEIENGELYFTFYYDSPHSDEEYKIIINYPSLAKIINHYLNYTDFIITHKQVKDSSGTIFTSED